MLFIGREWGWLSSVMHRRGGGRLVAIARMRGRGRDLMEGGDG